MRINMSNITQPSDRFLLTSDFAGSVTGDSATAVTAGDFSSAGRTGEFNMPASFGALMNWQTGDGSFSFWTTLSAATDRYDYIASDANATNYPPAGSLLFNNHTGNEFWFYYHQPPAGHISPRVSTVGWAVGAPIHVMLVKDSAAGDMKVYVNGVLENTSAWPSAAWGNADSNQWRFGGYNGSGTYDWPGSIADVAVWDGVALSSAEVSAIYSAGQGGEWTSGVAGVRKFKKRFWLSYDDGSYSISAASSPSDSPGVALTLQGGPKKERETVEIVNTDKALVGIGSMMYAVTAAVGTGNATLSASHDLSAILPEFGSECQVIRKKKNNPGTVFILDNTGKLFKAQSADSWDTISSASLVRDLTADGFPADVVDLSSDGDGRIIAIGKNAGAPTATYVDAEAGTIVVTSSIKPALAALSNVWDINYFPDTGLWYAADGAIPGPQTIISTDDITNWFDGTSMAAPSAGTPAPFPDNGATTPFNMTSNEGLYHFDGNANDTSGNGRNGTVNGATLTTGLFGSQAYQFGTSDYIDLGTASTFLSASDDFSVSLWIKGDAGWTPAQYDAIWGFSNDFIWNEGVGLHFQGPGEGIRAFVGAYNGFWVDVAPDNDFASFYNSEAWNHLAVTYTAGTLKIFLNGVLKEARTGGGTLTGLNQQMQLGRLGTYGNLEATIEEFAIWSRGLSDAEVAAIYGDGL